MIGQLYLINLIGRLYLITGFYHEQSRPDRDTYLSIFWNNIKKSMRYNFNKASEVNSLGNPYDYRSVIENICNLCKSTVIQCQLVLYKTK